MKKIDMIEKIIVAICSFFIIALTLYHISYDGYLGVSEKTWGLIWSVSENGLLLTLSFVICIAFSGIIRTFFTYIFIPYFIIKLIYQISCYSGIYIVSKKTWDNIWSFFCILSLITGIIITLKQIRDVA